MEVIPTAALIPKYCVVECVIVFTMTVSCLCIYKLMLCRTVE